LYVIHIYVVLEPAVFLVTCSEMAFSPCLDLGEKSHVMISSKLCMTAFGHLASKESDAQLQTTLH